MSKVPRPKSDRVVQITALVPTAWVEKLDARAAALSAEGLAVTRADVVRMILKKGLEADAPRGKR
jgi:hypothetical protein